MMKGLGIDYKCERYSITDDGSRIYEISERSHIAEILGLNKGVIINKNGK